jgi:uncharacterized protein YigA (DUF484 family)
MKAEIDRLLRMSQALEEMIALLERQSGENSETIRRLRILQGEILATVRLLQGDFSTSG